MYAPLAPEVQETIENYGLIAPELISRSPPNIGILAFQIEGNFTNSGNREIIAFYQYTYDTVLNAAFCFVLDINEEKVEGIYYIDWRTIQSTRGDQMEIVPGMTGDLARHIMWGDMRIGYVGDFNRNGKEELFLLRISGRNREPHFFEFDEIEFERVLDLDSGNMNIYINSVNVDEKIVNIHGESPSDRFYYIEKRSYMWDDETRRYKLIADSFKEILWNVDKWQYEEINTGQILEIRNEYDNNGRFLRRIIDNW